MQTADNSWQRFPLRKWVSSWVVLLCFCVSQSAAADPRERGVHADFDRFLQRHNQRCVRLAHSVAVRPVFGGDVVGDSSASAGVPLEGDQRPRRQRGRIYAGSSPPTPIAPTRILPTTATTPPLTRIRH